MCNAKAPAVKSGAMQGGSRSEGLPRIIIQRLRRAAMASDQCACGAYYEDGQWWMRWRERGHTHEPIDWRLPALKEDSDASIPD